MDYSPASWTVAYYIAYPIFYILNLILFVLALITAPLLHLGHYCLYACWHALRVLGKFETLYIFFGTAALVGIVIGTSLHFVSGFVTSMLNLESSHEEQRGWTLASYRAKQQGRRDAKDPMMKMVQNGQHLQRDEIRLRENHMDWNISNQDRGRSENRFNTILEEEDTSDGF